MSEPAGRRLVLTLILAEIRGSLRSGRRRDLVWAFGGGGLLAAYAIGIVVLRLNLHAEEARTAIWAWWIALPAALVVFGALSGLAIGQLALARAYSPFLKAQPLSSRDRRHMAAFAANRLGAPLIAIDAILVTVFAAAAGQPFAFGWGVGAAIVSAAGYFASLRLRLRRTYQRPKADRADAPASASHGLSLAWIDRKKPRWLSSWAGRHVAGRFRPTLRGFILILVFGLAALGAALGSIVNGTATPAMLAGVLGGLAVFMLLLRCAPLLSPVLRASSLSFGRAVRGLVRLPLALSLMFFGALAVPAYAAEPAMIAMPISAALGLLILNGTYTVFAVFFAHSRRLAAMAFVAALGLAAYESLEWGRTVLLGLVALLVFLCVRARKAYRHG